MKTLLSYNSFINEAYLIESNQDAVNGVISAIESSSAKGKLKNKDAKEISSRCSKVVRDSLKTIIGEFDDNRRDEFLSYTDRILKPIEKSRSPKDLINALKFSQKEEKSILDMILVEKIKGEYPGDVWGYFVSLANHGIQYIKDKITQLLSQLLVNVIFKIANNLTEKELEAPRVKI